MTSRQDEILDRVYALDARIAEKQQKGEKRMVRVLLCRRANLIAELSLQSGLEVEPLPVHSSSVYVPGLVALVGVVLGIIGAILWVKL